MDHPEPVETRLVTTRVNWSQGEDAKRLQAAVADWDHKSGEWLSLTPSMSLHMYARCVGISKTVLHTSTHILTRRGGNSLAATQATQL